MPALRLPLLSALAFAADLVLCSPAEAQTQLPGIVVTAPSPVVRPRRNPQPAVTNAQPQAQQQAEEQPSPASQPLPGSITIDDAFVPVTVATDRELLASEGSTITDTLMTKPGITGSTFAAGANRPIIRGLDNYRIRTQEDGIGTHDVSNLSEDHAVPVDPFAAERVEVVRGPATLRYGSSAIGGVVSIENNRIPSFVPPRGVMAEIKGGLSSADDGRDAAFSVTTGGASGVVVHADGFKRRSDDYDTPQGRQINSFVDNDGFSIGASYVWRSGFVGIAYARFNSLYGIPGAEALDARPRIDMKQDKVMSKGEWRVHDFGIDAIRFWFGSTNYAHNEIDFNQATSTDEIGSRFTNREQEGRLEVQHLPVGTMLGNLTGTAGAQWGHRNTTGLSFEGDSLLEPATTYVTAGYLFEELEVTKGVRLQAAARVEQDEVRGVGVDDPFGAAAIVGRDRTFTPRSAGLGALYELPLGVVARLTGQYVERAPDAPELFSKGAHDATNTFEIGDPGLDRETARTVELGFKRATGDLRFDSSLYYTSYGGFTFKRLTGVLCGDTLASCGSGDPDNNLKQVLFSQRDATFYGAELAVQYDVAPIWRGAWGVEGQYDFVHATFDGDGNVPRIPPHRVGAGLFYRDGNWFARVSALYAFRQEQIAANETPTSSYTMLNAELSYTFRSPAAKDGLGQEVTIGLKGENLLDDDIRNAVSFKKDEVLQPGRSVRLFGSIKLN